MPQWYSVAEAAEFLEVHENTLRNWITQGLIIARRVGGRWRISLGELERVLESGTRKEDEEGDK